jgi:integrase
MVRKRVRELVNERVLPSGLIQVYFWLKRPSDLKRRFYSKTLPPDSNAGDRRTWRDRRRAELKYGLTPALGESDDGSFAADAAAYLAAVTALPTYKERVKHIREWVAIFGSRPRFTIQPHEIRAQRDRWLIQPRQAQRGRKGKRRTVTLPSYTTSAVNKRLRALSNLWTVLHGRHAPNPVREVPEADEIEAPPRALPHTLIRQILGAMPDVTRPEKGRTPEPGSRTKARLEVMLWTGLSHSQLMRLEPGDVDWNGRSIYVRARRKGRPAAFDTVSANRSPRKRSRHCDTSTR